jgi:hypothetical protein
VLNSSSCTCNSRLGIWMKVVAHRPGPGSIAFDLRTTAMASLKEMASTSQARSNTAIVSFAHAATAPGSRPVQNPNMWTGPADCLECSLRSVSLHMGQWEVAGYDVCLLSYSTRAPKRTTKARTDAMISSGSSVPAYTLATSSTLMQCRKRSPS